MKSMKSIRFLFAAAAICSASGAVVAQTYPASPVRIIVPYQPGQGTDVATRYLADHLGRELGQPIVVENRAGAGGNIGAAEAARAAGDGYTLLMGTNGTHVLNPFLYSTMSFDPAADFEPIALVSTFPMVILANPNVPYAGLGELLADAKARPEVLNMALPSTTARLVLELMQKQSDTKLVAVPYKGSAGSMSDLVGGQVQVGIDTASASRALLESGRIKALAVTSLQDSALLPGVKTAASQGLDGFEVLAWNALYAPRGTPPEIVEQINAGVTRILERPEVRARLLELGHEPAGGTPADLTEFAQRERAKWAPVVRDAGLKVD